MYFQISRTIWGYIRVSEYHPDEQPASVNSFSAAGSQFKAIALASIWANGGLGGQIDVDDLPGIIEFRNQLQDGSWVQNDRPIRFDDNNDYNLCERYGFQIGRAHV